MKTTIQVNMRYADNHVVALRMFKRNGFSYSSITMVPQSSGMYHRAQGVATIH